MATTYQGAGGVVAFTTSGAVASGAVVIMADTVGIALAAATATGQQISVQIEGVFEVTKAAGTAIAIGDKVSWDASASAFSKGLTAASGDVIGCGVCVEAATSAATKMKIRLTPGTGAFTA